MWELHSIAFPLREGRGFKSRLGQSPIGKLALRPHGWYISDLVRAYPLRTNKETNRYIFPLFLFGIFRCPKLMNALKLIHMWMYFMK